MKIIITNSVSHKINSNYPCLLVQFEKGDRHFFKNDMNWMPKESELIDIIVSFSKLYKRFPKTINKALEELNENKKY